MTALEMTKLCAEAMGDLCMEHTEEHYLLSSYWQRRYDPLHDDAQAMALVKQFDIAIEREKDNSFGVTLFTNKLKGGNPVYVARNEIDLNRAVCTVVAKMQAAK